MQRSDSSDATSSCFLRQAIHLNFALILCLNETIMWDKQIVNLNGAHGLPRITSELYSKRLTFSMYEISLHFNFLINCILLINYSYFACKKYKAFQANSNV